MPTWMVVTGYIVFAVCAISGFGIAGLVAWGINNTIQWKRDDYIMFPILSAVAVLFFFACFWIVKVISIEHPWQDSLQYCVRIGADNEAVFLGGQAEKYSMEYRLLKRAARKHPKWLQEDTENAE